MLIGYIRISTNDESQLFDLQRNALMEAGIKEAQIYYDSVSGKKAARSGLQACLEHYNQEIRW